MTRKHRWTKWAIVSLILLVTVAFAFSTFSAYAYSEGELKGNKGDRVGRLLWNKGSFGDRVGRLLWGPKHAS